ncbi:hypothetical protein B0I37DRAFT_89272 [Chaetomium sp. MPI-CAGE-AT-0009]|nr:hypothetical protein B0I37DRAFT_89272 [Chaetomium sp. MPI-CAGE-AT-0009]
MADMGRLAGGAGHNDHSTLEVVHTQDYNNVAFNKNDKVAFVPSHEHDKIAVPPQAYDDAAYYHQPNSGAWRPQTETTPATVAQSGYTWDGDARAPGGDVGTGKKERILGLKRWVFFTVMGIVLFIVVAVGVGVGVGVGVSATRSTSNAEAGAAASSTSDTAALSTASTTSMQTPETATSSVQSATATSASRASTGSRSSTSSATRSTPSRQLVGGFNGRCTENWGSDCICLDENVCASTWNGTAQTGRKPDWPCPNDPVYVKACYVQPCKDASQPSSRCLWREDCAELDPGNGNPNSPLCPGGKDFICCAKLL